jgi:hypothetical protein
LTFRLGRFSKMVDLLGVSGVGRVNLHEKYDHPANR